MMISIEVDARWYVWEHVEEAMSKGQNIREDILDYIFESNYIREDFKQKFAKAKNNSYIC